VRTASGDDDGALRARRAYIETDVAAGDRYAVFEDGHSYAGTPGRLDYVVTRFERYAVRIENREPTPFSQHIGFLPTEELLRRDGTAYAIELQWRIALPLCTLLGPVLAVLVGLGSRRGSWYLGLTITVAGYFTYTNLLGAGRALMRQEVLPAALGLWPIHAAFAAVLAGILIGQRRVFRLRPRPRQELLRA
jgi:lipopolysaccharide export system permease protein